MLARLVIGAEYRGQAFIDRSNGVCDKTGKGCLSRHPSGQRSRSGFNAPPLRYSGRMLRPEAVEEFASYCDR